MAQELPYFAANGQTDMFWAQKKYSLHDVLAHCRDAWGVTPRPHWSLTNYGGLDLARHVSNVVFSNGLLDPWSAFGVPLPSSSSSAYDSSVAVVLIPEGAHHLDLMFSHPDDPPSVRAARQTELKHVAKWVAAAADRQQGAAAAAAPDSRRRRLGRNKV